MNQPNKERFKTSVGGQALICLLYTSVCFLPYLQLHVAALYRDLPAADPGLQLLLCCLLYTSVNGYEKKLEIVGVGLRCQKQGSNLVMNLGFSHQVNVPDTEDCTIVWQDPNHFSVTGIDKQKVGQYAAEIRAKKPPEPYKGKGIRYAGEVVKHKEGKAGKGKK